MKIILVHGILTDGQGNVDRLGDGLRELGHWVVDLELPKRGPFSARFTAREDARRLLGVSEPGDVVVAHSNGCRIAAHAMEQCAYRAAFLFRPAMRRAYKFPPAITEVFCFHSPDDFAIKVGSRLICHPFGRAGTKGFKIGAQSGAPPIIHNVARTGGHNDDFEGHRLGAHIGYIDQWVRGSGGEHGPR